MNLIMLCGCGSSGKSTFGKYLENKISNAKLISMDTIVDSKKYNYDRDYCQYIQLIQSYILSEKYQYIIIDFSHCSQWSRQQVLNYLNTANINLITISLRPGIDTLLQWQSERMRRHLTEEEKNRFINFYTNFEYPTVEEFIHYNFLSIINISIDNSKFNLK